MKHKAKDNQRRREIMRRDAAQVLRVNVVPLLLAALLPCRKKARPGPTTQASPDTPLIPTDMAIVLHGASGTFKSAQGSTIVRTVARTLRASAVLLLFV